MSAIRILLGALLVGVVCSAQAGRIDDTRERAKEMEARCEAERTEKLKPIQEAKVRECIAEGRKADWCQRYFRDYGWGRARGGTRAENLFYDLPVCEEAFRLRKQIQP
ncbi:hypothetical protein [Zestomonas carbonaria]|uniref:Uncharacterized protein n=1 Tax=Zestomonas carbonaria TaxID=2762745 RepID=A0A7U7IA37_9GAMM|nr:hypothetical protein [Pseudomonas carbonaria]CAD5107562.1 hypothetical protein PSEWESI4_01835 [Pseudomonas carbonaria]